MESTLITRFSPLLPSPCKSRPLSSSPLAGARRVASISFSPSSVSGVLRPRGGVTSSVTAVAAALGDAAEPASEAILLSVQGMMCDGCASSVKRILEGQPEVTSAAVDYKEARAVVWTTPEVKLTEDWQKHWGEKLASHLGTCGFESSPQGQGEA
ncbi:copper-transporting ATPase PAA1, chloroplastic-like [Lolium rigidum]|uniref:copper-transporting ATPase PAA1, chloroplastic-like n=1 Tax=Lolium rigidum TaxID=89674 RepID=UPI001F5CE501|nr:copper-transporting ATPase PAA1, chloroplastic-like [Lolium rigidum]